MMFVHLYGRTIHVLMLLDYLHVQADKPKYNYDIILPANIF